MRSENVVRVAVPPTAPLANCSSASPKRLNIALSVAVAEDVQVASLVAASLIVPVLESPVAVTVVASPVLPMLTVPLLLKVWPIARRWPPGRREDRNRPASRFTPRVPALLKVALATPPGLNEIGVGRCAARTSCGWRAADRSAGDCRCVAEEIALPNVAGAGPKDVPGRQLGGAAGQAGLGVEVDAVTVSSPSSVRVADDGAAVAQGLADRQAAAWYCGEAAKRRGIVDRQSAGVAEGGVGDAAGVEPVSASGRWNSENVVPVAVPPTAPLANCSSASPKRLTLPNVAGAGPRMFRVASLVALPVRLIVPGVLESPGRRHRRSACRQPGVADADPRLWPSSRVSADRQAAAPRVAGEAAERRGMSTPSSRRC